MRKVVVLNRVSIDGYFAGPNGEIDWFVPEPEVDRAAHELINPDTVLFGRVTYQLFESFWPDAALDPSLPEGMRKMGQELNEMTKVVFSQTLDEAAWVNSQLVKGDLVDTVRELKSTEGADFVIFGSGSIVQQLANAELIDDYLLVVTPVVLGSGRRLFDGVHEQKLNLVLARSFATGNVLLHYRHGDS